MTRAGARRALSTALRAAARDGADDDAPTWAATYSEERVTDLYLTLLTAGSGSMFGGLTLAIYGHLTIATWAGGIGLGLAVAGLTVDAVNRARQASRVERYTWPLQ